MALAGLTGCGGGGSSSWLIDAGFGMNQAKKENRPILFYFKEWDSTQHRNMRMRVLDHPDVRRELRETVNIELEFAWSDPYRKIYGVQKPQVCVMCDPEGNKVGTGLYVNPVPTVPRFLEWLRESRSLARPASPGDSPEEK